MKTSNTISAIIVCATTLLAAESCQRRPLTTADNNVLVNITIDKDIINHEVKENPELMRTAFFHDKNGNFATHTFLPHNGGNVNIIPRKDYDMVTYNFGTRNTFIEGEYEYQSLFATTNEVSESYKSKLKSRSTSNAEELIVFEPDHLFTGKTQDIYIPARGVDSPPVIIDVTAQTVVQSWIIYFKTIHGQQYIGSIAGVISGLSKGCNLAGPTKSDEPVSVFFEAMKLDKDGLLEIRFNTFGAIPQDKQVMSLVITDIAGQGHEFNVDITKQFKDNKEQIIRIETDITIEKPETKPGTGGGLAPEVDNWENIETDIII